MVSFDSNSNNQPAARLAQSAERLVHSSAGDRRSYSRGRTNSPGLKNRDTTFIILETGWLVVGHLILLRGMSFLAAIYS